MNGHGDSSIDGPRRTQSRFCSAPEMCTLIRKRDVNPAQIGLPESGKCCPSFFSARASGPGRRQGPGSALIRRKASCFCDPWITRIIEQESLECFCLGIARQRELGDNPGVFFLRVLAAARKFSGGGPDRPAPKCSTLRASYTGQSAGARDVQAAVRLLSRSLRKRRARAEAKTA